MINKQGNTKKKMIVKISDYLLFALIGFVLGAIVILAIIESADPGKVRRVDKGVPLLSTNEQFVNDTTGNKIDLENVESVWQYVFTQLADEVNVYPTENYFYFKFFDSGREIWGNIRFDVAYRQRGEISFAYFSVLNRAEGMFNTQAFTKHKMLGKEDEVIVREIDALTYTITYGNKTTVFHLNNVPQDLPADAQLREGEKFVARTFDESGFQLILIFDDTDPAFRFILDNTAPLPDVLEYMDERVVVGRRSGFAFYEDKELSRWVLIGVDYKNITVNNYYDGPFDQLADNFVRDDTFKNYAVRVFPALEGIINERGVFLDEDGNSKDSRLSLQPHLKYYSIQQLLQFTKSCREKTSGRQVVSCLTRDDKQTVQGE